MGSLKKLSATKICDRLKYLLREKHECKNEKILVLNKNVFLADPHEKIKKIM